MKTTIIIVNQRESLQVLGELGWSCKGQDTILVHGRDDRAGQKLGYAEELNALTDARLVRRRGLIVCGELAEVPTDATEHVLKVTPDVWPAFGDRVEFVFEDGVLERVLDADTDDAFVFDNVGDEE